MVYHKTKWYIQIPRKMVYTNTKDQMVHTNTIKSNGTYKYHEKWYIQILYTMLYTNTIKSNCTYKHHKSNGIYKYHKIKWYIAKP